jgi:hypothetical protein
VTPKLGTAANDATHEAEPRSGHTQDTEVEELVAASAAVDQPELVKEPAALEATPQGFMRSKEVGIDGVTRAEGAAADFSCYTPAATAAGEVGRSSARESSDDTTRENKRKLVDIHSNGKEINLINSKLVGTDPYLVWSFLASCRCIFTADNISHTSSSTQFAGGSTK